MQAAVDTMLKDLQAGFQRSRLLHTTLLAFTVELSLGWTSSLQANFIDYEKAFDSVDAKIWKLLRHLGLPQNLCSGTSVRKCLARFYM